MPYFLAVSCSQCGQEFGPGDAGFSHCIDHRERDLFPVQEAKPMKAEENGQDVGLPYPKLEAEQGAHISRPGPSA